MGQNHMLKSVIPRYKNQEMKTPTYHKTKQASLPNVESRHAGIHMQLGKELFSMDTHIWLKYGAKSHNNAKCGRIHTRHCSCNIKEFIMQKNTNQKHK